MREVASLGELRMPSQFSMSEDLFLDTRIAGMAIDSREINPAEVFFAMPGEHADGHQFIDKAQSGGAVAAVVERFVNASLPQVRVNSTEAAIGQLGASFREHLTGVVIGITGSAGKTSVKNLVRALLGHFGSVAATSGNLNNELGVPLTLASVPPDTNYVVIEMGAAQQGDIAYLVDIAKPTVSLVNNVGAAHVGRFGSIEITSRSKGEIYSKLGRSDTAVINLDGDYARDYLDQYCSYVGAPRAMTFSVDNSKANVFASDISFSDQGLASFTLHVNRAEQSALELGPFTSPTSGRHALANLLAAISILLACDCRAESIGEAIEALTEQSDAVVETGRMEIKHQGQRFCLIDDSYNASPDAMKVAVDQLTRTPRFADSTTYLIVGDMAELGDKASKYHREVGVYAAQSGVSHLLAVGEFAADYVEGFESLEKSSGQWAKRF